ncbi:unnamed protein product [Lupinus luteus]|uniref:Uncharacterized protein n=1 Tax=Lupinus luteus TaxID=3873 RepID=A0AAV1Y2R2_LUPLU
MESARVLRKSSSQEEDLMARSTKVKTIDEYEMESAPMVPFEDSDALEGGNKVSYPEMHFSFPPGTNDTPVLEDEDDAIENSWYKEVEEDKPFDACPEIQVTKDEFDTWCKPWKHALVVKLLGINLPMRVMESSADNASASPAVPNSGSTIVVSTVVNPKNSGAGECPKEINVPEGINSPPNDEVFGPWMLV